MKKFITLSFIVAITWVCVLWVHVRFASSLPREGRVLEGFLNPSVNDKPMVRMWFPDAGAGLDTHDTISKHLLSLSEAGFGGVEVAMLADGSELTNDEVKFVGWGTDAWRETLKKVLRVANSIEGGFRVDITLTAHWPLILNTIDPNDDAASQELAWAFRKVSERDLQNDNYELPLPETKLYDGKKAPFIFVDKLVSAALARVVAVKPGGGVQTEETIFGRVTRYIFPYVLDFNSIIVLDRFKSSPGYRAGVPDREALAKWYGEEFSYEDIVRLYGPEPSPGADFSLSFNGKRDSVGNRVRMADTQYYYYVDLSHYSSKVEISANEKFSEEVRPGDWIIVAIYRRGTGQVQSGPGSVLMYGRTYAVNYFDEVGAKAIIEFWEKNLLDDELRALLRQNALLTDGSSCFFEDSIELSTSSKFWVHDLLDELSKRLPNYPYRDKLPFVVGLGSDSFTEEERAKQIASIYQRLLGELYYSEHLEPLRRWANSLGYGYRAQAYGLEGVDPSVSAMLVDCPEGDNGTKGDGLRRLSGSVNICGKERLSMEAVTGWNNLQVIWADIIAEINQNYSDGVNLAILHGSPYNKSWNGFQADWPGWLAFTMRFGPPSEVDRVFADTYHYRQLYWEEAAVLGNYMARVQAVLRRGTPKVDLLVVQSSTLRGEDDAILTGILLPGDTGNTFQELLDNGYSYNIISENLLAKIPDAIVSNGRLYEEGPAYKAIIVNVQSLPVAALRALLKIAHQGLPVIVTTSDLRVVSDFEQEDESTNAEVMLEELRKLANVYVATSQRAILNLLRKIAIMPDACYLQPRLEATHYVDPIDGSHYYYFYNNTYPENRGMILTGAGGPSHASKFKGGEPIVRAKITLKGEGIPYIFDAWTGEIIPVAYYVTNSDGTVTMEISLSGGESTIVGILPRKVENVAIQDVHVIGKTG
ncbi:MAG: glycosyl hydrolase, partial [candidate division WOR-3 bacterium]